MRESTGGMQLKGAEREGGGRGLSGRSRVVFLFSTFGVSSARRSGSSFVDRPQSMPMVVFCQPTAVHADGGAFPSVNEASLISLCSDDRRVTGSRSFRVQPHCRSTKGMFQQTRSARGALFPATGLS